MEDLLQFLRNRLDEDETTAKAVGFARIQTGEYLWGSKYLLLQDGKGDESKATTEFDGGLAEHIARHDPARILAEVEAKRRIFEEYANYQPHDPGFAELELVVQLLALPYADHPDYNEAWRP